MNGMSRAERAVVVMMMEGIAVMPVPIVGVYRMTMPPPRPVIPVPRTSPGVPAITPEPVVDNRTVNENRFYDIVRTVYIFVSDNLNGYIVGLIFLYIDRCDILVDILGEDSLQYDQALVTFARFHYAQIIYLPVSVEVEVAECAVGVVEHRLELFQVLSLRKKLSYNLQIESFRDVRTVGRNRDRLVCP